MLNGTGQSLGFGFVKYESESDAFQAMAALNGAQLGRKVIKVSIAREDKSNIYVAGNTRRLFSIIIRDLCLFFFFA